MYLYLKQAWQLMKQNRFYSIVYIVATALSISLVMVLAIVFYIRTANIYPETTRDRLMVVEFAQVTTPDGNNGKSRLSLETVTQCIYSLETAEAVTAIYNKWGGSQIQPDNSDEQIPVRVKYTDTGFWNVFDFTFVEGKPFTEADMQSGMKTVVISESFARQLFGTTEVTGRYISLDFEPHRICGVVKDMSYIADIAFSQLWMPYSASQGLVTAYGQEMYHNTIGPFTAYVLAPSTGEVEKVQDEIRSNIKRYGSTLGDVKFTIHNQPDRYWQSLFRNSSMTTIDFTKILFRYAFICFIFILIPAISLSGMADSQMERRLSEMGIRRSFGARKKSLMIQLITENLLFTTLGAIGGLLLSYFITYITRRWIIHVVMGQKFVNAVPSGLDVELYPSMLMNYTIFAIAFGVCFILNLMVTVIPAWNTSKREIVYSLNCK